MLEKGMKLIEVNDVGALKRNDPCPCGSGKKYKKCCLKKLDTRSRYSDQDIRDFNELLPKLFDFSRSYDEAIKPFYEAKTAVMENLPVADARAFSQLLFHWMLFNWQVDEKHTILSTFIKEHESNYSNTFVSFLKDWKSLEPRFFYVKHADDEYIAVEDLWNKKSSTIFKTPAADKIETGDYVIGYLYPTPDGPSLGSDALQLPEKLALSFFDEMKRIGADKQKHFTKHFDQLLQLLAFQVEHGMKEEQAETTAEIMKELSVDSRRTRIACAVELRRLLAEKDPRITKTTAFAAGLDYWAGRMLSWEEERSQRAIAKKYSVSTSTVSTRYQQLLRDS
ncbi:SEC-C domain-containing protein [Alkalicoccus chagannorensis]|uniref:SEC-C domain-containing protein n=1 Tax=Alkalicoccus chagannorensis TaxID=427072 RepID=UPI0004052E39|nr:SEC-C domain-containing protein [Alkalicoccus chagannorensis]